MMASKGRANVSDITPTLPSAQQQELNQLKCNGVMPRARATSIWVEAETTVSHMTTRCGGSGQDDTSTAEVVTLATK
jgi:hypothetical protein